MNEAVFSSDLAAGAARPLAAPQPPRRYWRHWRGAVIPLAFLALWAAVVDTGLVESPLLVPLHRVAAAPFVDPDGRQLWGALGVSLVRLCAGFALGGALGVATGVAVGLSRPLRQGLAPSLHALRQIAVFAWIPLLTSWFGNGEAAKIVFISLSTFFPVFLNTEQGVRAVPAPYREVAAMLQLRRWRRLRLLVLPAALPSILIGLDIGLLSAWIGTVGAEYAIGVGRGLGSFLVAARELFRMDLVLCGVIALALVGYLFNRFARAAFARLIPWRTR